MAEGTEAGFWPAIAAGRPLSPEEAERHRAAAARLGFLVSPALADWLLSAPADAQGPLFAPDEVHRSRLRNRFVRAQGLKWLRVVAEEGIDVVCLKGLAATFALYPDPDLRAMGDVDILVRERDLGALIAALARRGFEFREAVGTPRWGHIGDASFQPFVSPDGAFRFDLHIQPDDYPTHRGLPVEAVFADAERIDAGGLSIRVPSGPHFLLLALTNAARDKLGLESVKAIVDALVFLARTDRDPGWESILAAARRGGFLRTVRALAAFLGCLGVPRGRLPSGAALGGVARRELASAVRAFAPVFPAEPSPLALQRREALLLVPPTAVVRRHVRRLRGLIRPWPGIPTRR